MPDMQCEFRRTGSQAIRQSGMTEAPISSAPQTLSVEIQYLIDGPEIAWSTVGAQILENANNTSSYDEATREITYNTYVRMLEA